MPARLDARAAYDHPIVEGEGMAGWQSDVPRTNQRVCTRQRGMYEEDSH